MTFDRKKSLTWGKRLIAVVLIMAGVFYGMLVMAEHYPEPIRHGLEDALSQATGKQAKITDLTTSKMVPDVTLRMTGVDILDAKEHTSFAHADRAYFEIPAWRMFLGLHDYLGIEVQGLQIASGFFLPKKLNVDFAGITDPNPDKAPASFVIDGQYNSLPLLVTAEMKRTSSGKKFLYNFSGAFPITFKLGDLEADGIFERGLSDVSFKQIQIVRGDHRAEFFLKNIKTDPMRGMAEGTIEGVEFSGGLSQSDNKVVFTITPKSTKADDIKKVEDFVALVDKDTGLDADKDAFRLSVVKAAELEPDNKKSQKTEKK